MKKTKKNLNHDALMRYARRLGTEQIHYMNDKKTGLQAVIAVHSNTLGSAIGGCRFYPYLSHSHAIKDVLRLSYMMTMKTAVSDLPHGGGKSVIICPPHITDREALFSAFGDFVQQVNGKYVAAMDMGTTPADMETISQRTSYVIGQPHEEVADSSPSPFTALGVFRGIQASVKHKLGRDDLDGIRVSVQGLGSVAFSLCKLLTEHGAIVTGCDINAVTAQRAADQAGVKIVDCNAIYDQPADIFSANAIGGTINRDTINRIDAKIIAGGANNQLAHQRYCKILQDKGVLYAPDFVINAGGIIQAASMYDYGNIDSARELTDKIYDRMLTIYERSDASGHTTMDVAMEIAHEKLQNGNQTKIEEVA